MHKGSRKFIKNAASNIVSGGASAIMAIVLPYYFVRLFRPVEFSLWVLVLQLAAYANFFNFGVQTAIGRYVAYALGRDDQKQAEDVLSAGLQILTVLAIAAFAVVAAVALFLPAIFTRIDPSMVGTGRVMLLWIGGALTLGLPFSAYLGVFVGLQRNDIPAVISLISKGGLAIALVVVAQVTHSLRLVAEMYFAVTVAGYLLQYVYFKAICGDWKPRFFFSLSDERKELVSYCASLSVWSISMLMVTGLDTTIVGIYDFKNVASYGVSANIVAFFIGIFRSLVSPILQVFAKYHAKRRTDQLRKLLQFSSSLLSILLLVTACWMILPAEPLFRIWVGSKIGSLGVRIFVILTFANVIRSSATPYANYLVAVGLQRKVYLSPFAEGVSNLLSSIGLAVALGAIGVAWGTVVGAVVGVAANYFYNFGRTMPPEFSIRHFFMGNIGSPLLAALPMLVVLVVSAVWHVSLFIAVPCMAMATLPSILIAWRMYRNMTGEMAVADLTLG